MPNMGGHKPKSAHEYQNTYYDDKTSDHGHYEPEITGKRYGRDGGQAKVTTMRWVEDDRSFESPKAPAEPKTDEAPAPEPKPTPQTSEQLKQAQDLVNSYTSDIMNNDSSIYNAPSDTPQASTSATAAESFLKSKKLDLGSGLSLK